VQAKDFLFVVKEGRCEGSGTTGGSIAFSSFASMQGSVYFIMEGAA